MSEFDNFFKATIDTSHNSRLLEGLEFFVEDQISRFETGEPLGMSDDAMQDFKTLSSIPLSIGGGGGNFKVDRSTSQVLEPHGVGPNMFLDHVSGMSVVDIGPGASSFLDDCKSHGSERTVALDINRQVLDMARYRGHEAYDVRDGSLPLATRSVDIIHSSHAAPFTSTPHEAFELPDQCLGALREGGYGIVHPIVPPMVHRLFEELMAREDRLESTVLAETGVPLARSFGLTAFCAVMLTKHHEGEVQLVASRYVIPESAPRSAGAKRLTLPSSLIFRKVAQS